MVGVHIRPKGFAHLMIAAFLHICLLTSLLYASYLGAFSLFILVRLIEGAFKFDDEEEAEDDDDGDDDEVILGS